MPIETIYLGMKFTLPQSTVFEVVRPSADFGFWVCEYTDTFLNVGETLTGTFHDDYICEYGTLVTNAQVSEQPFDYIAAPTNLSAADLLGNSQELNGFLTEKVTALIREAACEENHFHGYIPSPAYDPTEEEVQKLSDLIFHVVAGSESTKALLFDCIRIAQEEVKVFIAENESLE